MGATIMIITGLIAAFLAGFMTALALIATGYNRHQGGTRHQQLKN
jgi:hypothetical protein